MPSWRCPHCSTPQPEASRCWVCRRSSTSCGTCRHFRGSVAAKLGFCGLDRGHGPLVGDEVRACWEDGAVAVAPDPVTPGLLDLLTVAALGDTAAESGSGPPSPNRAATALADPAGAGSSRTPGPGRRPIATATGSRRLWVEVEA